MVPGAITSPYAQGSNRLMCQGALPVVDFDSFDDALEQAFEALPLSLMPRSAQGVASPQAVAAVDNDPLLRALSADAYSPDELVSYFDFTASELLKRLSQYEMQGLVEKGRDGRYRVCVMRQ